MTDILIVDDALSISDALDNLLSRRRVDCSRCALADMDGKTKVLVCGASLESDLGGLRFVTEIARKVGSTKVVIVDESVDEFGFSEERGGSVVRVGVPVSTSPALYNGPLLLLAELISSPFNTMVAADTETSLLLDNAMRVARFDVSVFITGPTGSGKEVIARQIHKHSMRASQPFVAVNCAAIPEDMLEAMLFGYERGAFTGAAGANKGIFRAADGGTLLLDEISEMSLSLQAKLLRVLQERVITPIGSQAEIPIDVRILATSNRDMEADIRARRFREDLYYRLNVYPIETLALSERPDDIPLLAQSMLHRHAPDEAVIPVLMEDAMEILCAHTWPGNVRELENVMQRALVLADGSHVTAEHIMIVPGHANKLAARAA